MLAIAGPTGLTFLREPMGIQGVKKDKTFGIFFFFKIQFFKIPRASPGTLASNIISKLSKSVY